jgi:SAM-dependent methyltransferase
VDSAEYDNLAALERDHWYYSGKRRLVRAWIERLRPPSSGDLLLDCGAGTGLFAAEMESLCRVLVLDDHEEALRMLRARFQPGQVLSPERGDLPLPDASLDYLTALDVLEHIPDDAAAVRGFARVLRPGGLAVVTVPAGRALWSDWDVALHHQRRYARRELGALFAPGDWDILHVNHTNVVAYPAVWLLRRWRGRRGTPPGTEKRAEDRLPPRWLNALLRATFVGAGLSRVPFPFGVSLLLAARRRG